MHYLTRHLRSVEESYFQHLGHAMRFALTLLAAGLVCLIHAIFPFLFEKTGSSMIGLLYRDMVTDRHKLTPDRVTAGR